MRKKQGIYEFETKLEQPQGWGYKIYTSNPVYNELWGTDLYRESEELFDTRSEAEFAAVGHISLIENGEG